MLIHIIRNDFFYAPDIKLTSDLGWIQTLCKQKLLSGNISLVPRPHPAFCSQVWGRAWEQGERHSLVPRPSLPPVFDRILYAKTEGEGVTCVTSGRREGRREGGGDRSL